MSYQTTGAGMTEAEAAKIHEKQNQRESFGEALFWVVGIGVAWYLFYGSGGLLFGGGKK